MNVLPRAQAFVESRGFKNMVRCTAMQIAKDALLRRGLGRPGARGEAGDAVGDSNGAAVGATVGGGAVVGAVAGAANKAANEAPPGGAKVVAVFLATDAAMLRERFASELAAAVMAALPANDNWRVEAGRGPMRASAVGVVSLNTFFFNCRPSVRLIILWRRSLQLISSYGRMRFGK